MKALIMHVTFDMRIGGTEQVIKNLIEGNDKDTLDMSIFCLEQPIGPFGELLLDQGIRIDSVQRKEGFDVSVITKIRKHIKQYNIDILHCHQYTPWVYGALAAIGTSTKVIFTEHGRFYPDRSSWKRKYINPLMTLLTDDITAISKATKQALVDFEYIPEEKIDVIYNGIIPVQTDSSKTEKLKEELGINTSKKVIGTIARLDPIKNHQMMFRAFQQVVKHYSDIVLILVGDGEERQNLEELVDDLGIRDHVIFTGYISQPQHYLDCMDIFLLSSFSEGTSMTLLEAMSLSKPCVVTNAGGNPEIIKHMVNGLVTENDNQKEFAKGILKLISEGETYSHMQTNAKQRFDKLFSASLMVEQYSTIYSHSLSGKDHK
jgi:glycosyltransferase involved in cell wall biosynthesis